MGRKVSAVCAYDHPMDGRLSSGRRYCKTCNKARVKAAYQRKKISTISAKK